MEIIETKTKKFLRSETYNYNFDKQSGFFMRWGETAEDDPEYGLPEIADIEISTICNGPDGIPCGFCYKKNTSIGNNMTIDVFNKILDKLPKSVTQIAYGSYATTKSNPDIWKIMAAARERGIVPNITVANVDNEGCDNLAKYCGAVAVSRYKNKDWCYDTVKRLTDRDMNQVNIHMLLSSETLDQVFETLYDIKNDSRLAKLNAIVFLSLKQKGRGVNYNSLTNEQFNEIVKTSLDGNLRFGFDSCSSHKFMQSIDDKEALNHLSKFIEPCESSLFSAYIDVFGNFHPCSFSPDTNEWDNGMSVLECNDFLTDIWYSEKVTKFRKTLLCKDRVCPLYNI